MEDQDTQRVALVTDGTDAMGLASAVELARRGWCLFLQHDEPDAAVEQAVDQAGAAALQSGVDVEILTAAADIGLADDRERLVERVLEAFGRIDMLVNAAARTPVLAVDLLEMTEGTYQNVMSTGVTSTLFLTQRVANEMVRLVEAGMVENPKIVTINSISAYTTSADHASHCMSRSALSMMTQLFADRLGEYGVNVYEIRAGLLSAGPSDAAHDRYDKPIEQGLMPIRRWGHPGDVARAVAAIAEDLLAFSTGEIINVDGGFHLRRL